ncbi:putative capsid protein of prophage CP-933C (major head protein) [Xenorhabdus nematophila ATCC 19061]|uniref:Capsid protein of prophage CP-933C ( major head protein) n=1 Tax=Xenorhabdus nematophila (strain ATCC 19061 / DSM 3370 / CCUG 14189 / LMG 1036 / NCIMB 9965 / AN6) TaxID=406817 RepID=D3VCF5_XENNA|nr:phage major capsid protein [Xenorhabdus nematophila]CBJ91990.1 putative capsid protein of prophage CP-933C (major head protein) [Xenorhabdus nematophila ATCC 19061]CEE92705.1 putative capsid protein of prophage CP-933C (major head protein) [Xenorhabdus nematophila str. Anatoliense]CEK24807.1 putative capsid protein of prophage CP-933C (major head protein) [Xenorhabdus nematophila AN6/1]
MKKLLELRQQKADLTHQMRTRLTKAEDEKRSLTHEEAKQFDELRHYILTGETRSLSTDVPSDGGYTISPELNKQIMQQLTCESVMRQICTIKTTRSNEYKQLVSVGGAAVAHGEEGKARGETATPKMEEVSIKLFPIYAYPKTTQEIIDFSDVDILGWLTSEIADTFVDTEETDLVSGDGSKKAKGFLSYPRDTQADKVRDFGTLQKLEATTLEADSLIDLKFLLKNKYRKNAVWVMNSGTAAQVQKLKNGNGDYIWRERLQAGDPDMLLGLPVHYLEFMPEGVIGLGDFKRGYFIVDHETGIRTRPDNITEPGFYKVHTDKYLGGGLVDSNAIKVLEVKSATK